MYEFEGFYIKTILLTAYADSDIDTGESLLANDEKWLLEFELKGLWLNLFQWFTIDLDKTLAGLTGGDSRSGLLTAIDLDGLSWCWHFYPTLDLNKITDYYHSERFPFIRTTRRGALFDIHNGDYIMRVLPDKVNCQ